MNLSWGNWDVRVYAAEAWLSLAPRFAAEHPHIVDMLESMVADPVPQVRLQVARSLQVISDAAPERMWAIAYRVAAEEQHDGVLASFLVSFLRKFTWQDPDHCEAIVEIVRARLPIVPVDPSSSRDGVQSALGGFVAQLWARQGRPAARVWLEAWSADPITYGNLLDSYSSQLRGAFFHRYDGSKEDDASAMTDRAQEGLDMILSAATRVSAEHYAIAMDESAGADDRKAAGQAYQMAERVTHHAMNQLYFGSGAHANEQNPALGLPTHAAMARFLTDYAAILELLAVSGYPATVHHLIELYEYLIPGAPSAVFDAIHSVLLGSAAREGYHHESLGNSAVVRLIRRYIADYRSIFEDQARRTHLVEILQLFSDVGWAEALKLLYDLPDLLR